MATRLDPQGAILTAHVPGVARERATALPAIRASFSPSLSPWLADLQAAVAHRRPGRRAGLAARATLLLESPLLRLLLIHRCRTWLQDRRARHPPMGLLARVGLAALALPKWLAQVQAQSQFSNGIRIAGGVRFCEPGQIMFGALTTGGGSVIGPRVTVGSSHIDGGQPHIGQDVWIGADSVIFGGIRIGDGATLLPGTVLTKSVPPRAVMGGNPARLLLRNFDNSALRTLPDQEAAAQAARLQST